VENFVIEQRIYSSTQVSGDIGSEERVGASPSREKLEKSKKFLPLQWVYKELKERVPDGWSTVISR
jgi:hypothetical protein